MKGSLQCSHSGLESLRTKKLRVRWVWPIRGRDSMTSIKCFWWLHDFHSCKNGLTVLSLLCTSRDSSCHLALKAVQHLLKQSLNGTFSSATLWVPTIAAITCLPLRFQVCQRGLAPIRDGHFCHFYQLLAAAKKSGKNVPKSGIKCP